jgi:transposase
MYVMDHTDPQELREAYWGQGMTLRDIAAECDLSTSAILHQMKKHGIERRGSNDHSGGGRQLLSTASELRDEEWLREKYYDEGLKQSAIAELLGTSQGTVGRYMMQHGITARKGGPPVETTGELSEEELQAELITALESSGYELETEKPFGDWRCDVYEPETDTAFEVKGWGSTKPKVLKAIGQACSYSAHGAGRSVVVIPSDSLRSGYKQTFDKLSIGLLVFKDGGFESVSSAESELF